MEKHFFYVIIALITGVLTYFAAFAENTNLSADQTTEPEKIKDPEKMEIKKNFFDGFTIPQKQNFSVDLNQIIKCETDYDCSGKQKCLVGFRQFDEVKICCDEADNQNKKYCKLQNKFNEQCAISSQCDGMLECKDVDNFGICKKLENNQKCVENTDCNSDFCNNADPQKNYGYCSSLAFAKQHENTLYGIGKYAGQPCDFDFQCVSQNCANKECKHPKTGTVCVDNCSNDNDRCAYVDFNLKKCVDRNFTTYASDIGYVQLKKNGEKCIENQQCYGYPTSQCVSQICKSY